MSDPPRDTAPGPVAGRGASGGPASVLLEQFITYPPVESLLTEGTWAVAWILEVLNEHGESDDGRLPVTLRMQLRPLDGAPPYQVRLPTNVPWDAVPHVGDRYLARCRPGSPGWTALLRPLLPDAPDGDVASWATAGAIDAPMYDDFVQHIHRSRRRERMLGRIGLPLLAVGLALLAAGFFSPIGFSPGGGTLLGSVVLLWYAATLPRYGSLDNIRRSSNEKPKIDVFALVTIGRPAVAVILGTSGSLASDGTPMVLLRVRLEPLDEALRAAGTVEVERLAAMPWLGVPRLQERFPAIYDPDCPERFLLTSPTPLPRVRRQPPEGEQPARISRSLLLSRLERLCEQRLAGGLSEAEFTRGKVELLREAEHHL